MSGRPSLFVIASVLVAVLAVGAVAANAAQDAPLDENENATLWSKEPNPCFSDVEYREEYGENPTDVQQLATCTDITFQEPPSTAALWTAADFSELFTLTDIEFDLTVQVQPRDQGRARDELQKVAEDLKVDADLERSVRSTYLHERAEEAAATYRSVEGGPTRVLTVDAGDCSRGYS